LNLHEEDEEVVLSTTPSPHQDFAISSASSNYSMASRYKMESIADTSTKSGGSKGIDSFYTPSSDHSYIEQTNP
jgi:hypothetical protein